MKCDRCGIETNTWTMSMFNTEHICMQCKKNETQHPKYREACDKELEQVKKGNYNFPGIGFQK